MIEGLSGVIGRIGEINSRIDEIRSIGKNPTINPVNLSTKENQENKTSEDPKFSEILQQVLEENNNLPGQDNLLEYNKINQLAGTKNDNKELLELLYKNLKTKSGSSNVSQVIDEASHLYHVDKSLIKAVIQQESQYNPEAVSPKGAMGLMQLMPQTAEILGVNNPFDVRENVMGGTRFLKALLNKYDNDLNLSLAAYNAGPEAVDKFGGIPPYEETENYVKNVLQSYNEFNNFK
jgi:soluble lytic murein transglycosylase-like protein